MHCERTSRVVHIERLWRRVVGDPVLLLPCVTTYGGRDTDQQLGMAKWRFSRTEADHHPRQDLSRIVAPLGSIAVGSVPCDSGHLAIESLEMNADNICPRGSPNKTRHRGECAQFR
jgi:hypothetical protein